MSPNPPPANPALLTSLRSTSRREVLEILRNRSAPIDVQELATNLAARVGEKSLLEVTPEEVAAIRVDLRHVHLPHLSQAGLVDWDRSAGTVTTMNHPALSDPTFEAMLAVDAPDWNAVVDAVASRRRRVVLATLRDADGPLTRPDLVERVHARLEDAGADESLTPDELLTELHHAHLPKLEAAGLVASDDAGTVEYHGHPALADEWLDFGDDETPSAILPSARRSDDLWTIEGREDIVAHGQSLFDAADDELFLMVTTDGLLDEECIRRLQAAVDRGVDAYLGSQTPAVRDLVRERVPEVSLWEPQLDWLNLPPDHETVGRLVMADREAVMLATLGDETDGPHREETAIAGAGENNPLVALLRELLGSRLDHLDAQSEDFLEQLPL